MIAVIGESLVDLVNEDPSGTSAVYHAMAGGSPYNVSVATARLGIATRLYSLIGDDAFGRLLIEGANRDGVDLSGVVRSAGWTGLAVTAVDGRGAASYEFRIDDAVGWGWSDMDLAGLAEATIVHFGSIASWRSPGDAVIRTAVEKSPALITYDPNVRTALIGSHERAVAMVEQNIAVSNLVKASDEDIEWLYPEVPIDTVADRWLALGPDLVVVTAGADGVTAFRAGRGAVHRPAFEVTVVDTVGAGDSGMATLLAGLHERQITTSTLLADIGEADVVSILDDAVLAAGMTCSRRGADPPTAAELDDGRARHRIAG